MSARAQRYCVTFWSNPRDNLTKWMDGVTYNYGIVSREVCPRTGKEHFHGYFELAGRGRRTMDTLKRDLGDSSAHVEPARGTSKQAIEYVKKDGEIICEWGEPKPGAGHRSDLDKIREDIEAGKELLDIAAENFGDWVRYHRGLLMYKDLLDRRERKQRSLVMPTVIIFVGPAGSGKSYHCFGDPDYQESGYQYLAQMSGKAYFDGYEGQKCIWFDEFNGSTMSFSLFCRIADKYGCRVETKGGSVELKHTKILISSVEWPATWWAESAKFLRDPGQLYRRITKMVYTRGPDQEPLVLKKEGWIATNIEEYNRLTSEE